MPCKDDQNEFSKMFNCETRYPIDTQEIYRQILIHKQLDYSGILKKDLFNGSQNIFISLAA